MVGRVVAVVAKGRDRDVLETNKNHKPSLSVPSCLVCSSRENACSKDYMMRE